MDDIYMLPSVILLENTLQNKIIEDYNRFANKFPKNIEEYILKEYKIDISTFYHDISIRNPFGKASGQLSSNFSQIEKDIETGLGFVVLKTVIAVDSKEKSEMEEWKFKSPQMKVESIISESGQKGWTVSWKGRGWSKSFEKYINLFKKSLKLSKKSNIPVIASCQYHLPKLNESFNIDEYEYTTNKLLNTWHEIFPNRNFKLEVDFSPTLLEKALKMKDQYYYWLKNVPSIIKETINGNIDIGLKLLNPAFDEMEQVEVLKFLMSKVSDIDYLILFNRLFDSKKTFMGKKGIAYGGYDLSDRNLKILSLFRNDQFKNKSADIKDLPISATGNINSGKMMIEYALRGCKNGQLHTFFQLPAQQYKIQKGPRSKRALHELLFNPENGLVLTLTYLRQNVFFNSDNILYFNDISNLYKNFSLEEIKNEISLL